MRRARSVMLVVGLAALASCGDDGGSAPNPPPTSATPKNAAAAGAGGGSGSKIQLTEKLHVEDRVVCVLPERPSDPSSKCDPKAPSCPERQYCTPFPEGTFCEACPERDGIRHVFKDRDFVAAQNRDPFAPGGTQITTGTGEPAVPPTEKCRRDDQFVATSYSYADLKLVGIVAQGTQRKVLMMGGPLGYIIKRGDCVGKEKAVVTDIGTGYITFQIEPDPLSANQRPPQEFSVQLNPKQLAANDPNAPPQTLPRTTLTPLVAPPVLPPPPRAPQGGGATVIVPGTAPPAGTVMAPGSNITPAVTPGSGAAAVPGSVTGAGSAAAGMPPGNTVPLVVPASPAAPAGAAAPPPATAPARVFVPAPRR